MALFGINTSKTDSRAERIPIIIVNIERIKKVIMEFHGVILRRVNTMDNAITMLKKEYPKKSSQLFSKAYQGVESIHQALNEMDSICLKSITEIYAELKSSEVKSHVVAARDKLITVKRELLMKEAYIASKVVELDTIIDLIKKEIFEGAPIPYQDDDLFKAFSSSKYNVQEILRSFEYRIKTDMNFIQDDIEKLISKLK